MAEERINRKLAAILAADVVGYSLISRGLFFGSPRPYGMWHEDAISHPPREV